uniref:BTB domain-containing protein n=1 Tax=Denticeps clupeoides TaxID=299321 RepID=A0AAY4EF92_9TELE
MKEGISGDDVLTPSFLSPSPRCLHLFPNGLDCFFEGFLSYYVVLVRAPDAGVQVGYKLAVLNAEGQEEMTIRKFNCPVEHLIEHYFGVGFSDMVRRRDILDEELGYLNDDTLTLSCEVSPAGSQVMEPDPNMAEDLGQLWDASLLSDCTVCVAGQEFKAHKSILAARCPVFRAMFTHDMRESRTNHVDIKDMELDIFKEILTFSYTGTAPNVHQMASELIVAADMVAYGHTDSKTAPSHKNLLLFLSVTHHHQNTDPLCRL